MIFCELTSDVVWLTLLVERKLTIALCFDYMSGLGTLY